MRTDPFQDESCERREAPPAWQAWLETAALAGAAVTAGALVDASDPFLLRRGYPWLALAPLLAGLRYGAGHGVVCGAAQVVALALASRCGRTSPAGSLAEIALGWLVAGLVPGEFRDAWVARRRRLEACADALRLRLDRLSRAYHALEASHDRLERETGGASTLRDALDALHRELATRPEAAAVESMGGRILALLGDHASVWSATLHPVDAEGRAGPAVATLGAGADARGDPLVREAARRGEVVSVRELPAGSGVLAAVPLVDVRGRVHAVVAVRDMRFVALNAETLALLAVVGGQLGELVSRPLPPRSSPRDERPPQPSTLRLERPTRHGAVA
jgi:hypothetical protein